MISWSSIEDSFKQRDKDWFTKMPMLGPASRQYLTLDGVYEPPFYASEKGTSNLQPGFRKYKNTDLIEQLNDILRTYKLSAEETTAIKKQISLLKQKVESGAYLAGNPFDMQGPDEVPGPKQVIHEPTGAGMAGLESRTWKNVRDVHDNSSERYKNLLPNN